MTDNAAPTLFLLSFLGGTGWQWRGVRRALHSIRTVTVDLPGFGDSAEIKGYGVAAMADHVAAAKRASGPGSWAIAGHSMGAKVAAALARRAEAGEPGLEGLTHLIALAGSPPAPEPMLESKRAEMLTWFRGGAEQSLREAAGYVAGNVAEALDPETHARAAEEVVRTNLAAWRAWLESGSLEDWSDAVGILQTPALLIAGGADEALGPDAQARLLAPHFADAQFASLPGAAHLLPLECAQEVADLIRAHLGAPPKLESAYLRLITSGRVSANTRAALLKRLPDPAPTVLAPDLLATLRAITGRVLPQPPGSGLDLAARIDAVLAGPGDGWRFDALPPDAEAYRTALAALPGFASLDLAAQDQTLAAIADGTWQGVLAPSAMQLWFEDVRAAAARAFVSHPCALARMGYSGIAYGGDKDQKPGFTALGPGEREPWEPEPVL